MQKNKTYFIHILVGLVIMFIFRFIPVGVLPNVTEVGMQVLGIFLGTIYLWTTIDPTVSSLISIAMLALSDYAASGAVLASWFGNPVVVQIMFLMLFMGGLTNRKLTVYIGRWLLTRKFVEGRPWVFTTVVLVASYFLSAFVSCWAPMLLFWPILYGVFEEIGFKKEDQFPKMLVHSVVMAALIGFPVPPYMANGLALLSNYRGIVGNYEALAGVVTNITDANYFIGSFVLGLVLIAAIILVMRFVFRPDVTPLKSVTIEMLNKNPLPPMNKAQKIYGYALVAFIALMLLPSLFPTVPGLSFLNANNYVICVVLVIIMCAIRVEDGPVLKIGEVMGKEFAWPSFWLCVTAIMIGSVLTNESTGITPFLNAILGPIFNGMSGAIFTVVILVVAIVLTNLCNSLVIGMILQPVILAYCAASGTSPSPIISIMIFTVLLSAACTPAASPFAAMLFGNKEWLTSKDVYKYSLTMVLVETIIIVVIGIPFINMLH